MRRLFFCSLVITLATAVVLVWVAIGGAGDKGNCTTIQDGTLIGSDGSFLVLGYDQFGYNYQAHIFNGRYCDYDRVTGGEYCDVHLVMKWNNAWLSNTDCDEDELLDPHYGFDSYIGSGAWATNHMSGKYEVDGKTCKWYYFVKIVAVPADAYVNEPCYNENEYGTWYAADGTEIGTQIWGSFAIIQRIINDPCAGLLGKQYISPVGPGFGIYKP